ncbi:MAG: hypothetical protein A2Z51_10735 [Deltaproteobacteria bacterium RBG_19FT_COMBO_52_11]|nr:MAG: hypothetical protein A2Z51_10735 [Deltaproteobacteria bacterium RBG_19FT_COMBO_52_11]
MKEPLPYAPERITLSPGSHPDRSLAGGTETRRCPDQIAWNSRTKMKREGANSFPAKKFLDKLWKRKVFLIQWLGIDLAEG